MMARGLKFRIEEVEDLHYPCTAKTKALIAKLICGFVFLRKSWFTHDEAQIRDRIGSSDLFSNRHRSITNYYSLTVSTQWLYFAETCI